MVLIHNLFSESIQALSKETIAAASPFTDVNLASKLLGADAEDKVICDKIVKIYGLNGSNLQAAAIEPNFYAFAGVVETAFQSQKPPVLDGYDKIQGKLSELVSLAYYNCQKKEPKGQKRFLIHSDISIAKQVATGIMKDINSTLRLGKFLDSTPDFKNRLELAIVASLYNEKLEKTKPGDKKKPEPPLAPEQPAPPPAQ